MITGRKLLFFFRLKGVYFLIFKSRKWGYLFFLFLVLMSFRVLWLFYHFPSEQPLVHDGILDLSMYELKDNQTIQLDGEWEFSPGHLLKNDELKNAEWTKLSIPSKNTEDKYGTYRLKIVLNENQNKDKTYGIRIPSVKTASALFINGELKGESGKVANNLNDHIGKDEPYTAYFTTNQKDIDLVLQVSNFDTIENIGINKSIKFGSAEAMLKEQNFTKTLVTGMVVVLLLHSIYSLLIYFFILRDKIVLFFTVGFIFPALDEMITYDKSFINWLQLDYQWSLKLTNLIYLASIFFFVQFMRVLLKKYKYHKIFRWFSILYALGAISIILMPTPYLLPANGVFFILYFVSFLSVLLFAFKEFLQNQKESLYLALISVSTTSGIIWGVIKAFIKIEIPFYPFDYLIAFLGFAAYWFERYDQKNKEARELVLELQKEDKLKDQFLIGSAEKLWTPLNEMITIGQMIINGNRSSLAKKDKNDLIFLIHIGRTMFFTLQDIVDFTRLKEGRVQIHPKSLNIHGVVLGVFDMLQFLTDEKHIQMKTEISPLFPNVMADEKRIIQVLFNLLHNAIKYTNSGLITVDAEIKDEMAVIHIRDQGIGMSEKIKNDAFSPYEQENSSEKGIGIGLTICKYLVELHGGTIHFTSVLNQGSDFYFTLPLATEKITEEEKQEENINHKNAPEDYNSFDLQNTKDDNKQHFILVIDDDPVNLKVINSIFYEEYYNVTTVSNPKKVKELLIKNEWDLLIIDSMMPFMSGYEITRLIRRKYKAFELPILLITSRDYPQDVYTGFSAGANDYVVRPINSLELKTRAKALINFKHSVSEHLYMEAAWLQAQIQPHFLFNTLNTIASLSLIDTDRMIALLNKFGEYLRRSFTPENLKRVVPIENEIELVKSYIYIEKERFGNRLTVEWDLDETLSVKIPPLSIQPLVENAIHHGILPKNIMGKIVISIKDYEEFVKISIIDDGVGMNEEQVNAILINDTMSESVAVKNINRRLKTIYGEGIKITSTLERGTEVSFKIHKF